MPAETVRRSARCDPVGAWLRDARGPSLSRVGHRVVHGGPDHDAPVAHRRRHARHAWSATGPCPACTSRTILRRSACDGDPPELAAGRLLRYRLPSRPCRWPITTPFRAHFYDEGVRRYGFHGLSYEYVAERLARDRAGSWPAGASLSPISAAARPCARLSRGEASRARMGSRRSMDCRWARGPARSIRACVLYLLQQKGMSAAGGRRICSTSDCRAQRAFRHQQRHARSACQRRPAGRARDRPFRPSHRRSMPGMLAAALGGLDAFVFTAGVGENSAGDPRAHRRQARLARSGARPGAE